MFGECVCMHPVEDHGHGVDPRTGEETWPCDWCGCPNFKENR